MTPQLSVLPGLLDAAHWIAWSSPYLAVVVAAGAVVWAWKTWRRSQLVREALAHRTVVEVIPTSTFDPGEGEVGRWARQLGRVPAAADGVPARGAAARLRYSVENGKMRCYLEGPAQAAAILAMPGFAEVEVRTDRAQQDIRPVRFNLPAQPGERA
ncbi:hypothetical protein ABT071_34710 [Streptomyces sp. NPDC002506]|uniref:hypothetical protein n=1 Tax=Streptomyces sp. NPDC002506 TaxID=3154536 RepID=UPI003332EABD